MTTRRNKDRTGTAPALVRDPEFSERLLRWFDSAARDLPWRRTRDPYAIWVSEIMLQQTRVETVRPYYTRFLERFPDPAALGAAPEEEVLSLWSGLGYYSRARNLRRGAGVVSERHGGVFPRDRREALEIPGIGPYTSAAILSIAYGLPHAVVDGNVARVLARVLRLDPPWSRRPRFLEDQALALLDPARAGAHNEAMMELGATVCRPRNPDCEACPVATLCQARLDDVVRDYPSPSARRDTVELEQVVFLGQHHQSGLLLERGQWPLLPHLWLPPIVEYAGPEESWSRAWGRWADRRCPELAAGRWSRSGTFRHSITHHRIRFHVVSGSVEGGFETREDLRLVRPEQWEELGHSSILTKAVRTHSRYAATPRQLDLPVE